MESKILVILGMMRSGTSLVASWIHTIGIDMGDNLRDADDIMNEEGFFEDIDFDTFHIKINNRRFDNKIIDNLLIRYPTTSVLYETDTIIASKLLDSRKSKPQWGWKSPLTTIYWQCIWHNVITNKQIGDKVFLLGLFRDYEKVIDSCIRVAYLTNKRDKSIKGIIKFSIFKLFISRYANFYLSAWIEHSQKLLDIYKNNNNCYLINIELFVEKEKVIFDVLSNFGFDLKYIPFLQKYKSHQFNRKVNLKYILDKEKVKIADSILENLKTNTL